MVVKATSVGSEVVLNTKTFASKAQLKIKDGLKASIVHSSGNPRAVGVTLSGKKWEVAVNPAMDWRLKYKGKLGGSTLTVRQFIPGNKWALLPTPVFELSRSGVLGEHGKLEVAYDFQNRVAAAEQTLYGGEDKRHKAWVRFHGKAGAAAGLRSKLKAGPLLHSAAAAYSEKGGWLLSAKSKFSDGTKVKTSYAVDKEELFVAAKHSPKGDSKPRPTLTLGLAVPVRQQKDPRVTLGLKWDL